jgi:hypothetical protein
LNEPVQLEAKAGVASAILIKRWQACKDEWKKHETTNSHRHTNHELS